MNAFKKGYCLATRATYLNGRKWERIKPMDKGSWCKPWTVMYATDKGDDFSTKDRILSVR